MFCLIYRSRARIAACSQAEMEMVLDARDKNARLRISGYLHREGETFVQYLEGERAEGERLYAGISRDAPHEAVELLTEGARDSRLFAGWGMGFAVVPLSGARIAQASAGEIGNLFAFVSGKLSALPVTEEERAAIPRRAAWRAFR